MPYIKDTEAQAQWTELDLLAERLFLATAEKSERGPDVIAAWCYATARIYLRERAQQFETFVGSLPPGTT